MGSCDERNAVGAMNLKQSEVKSYETPCALGSSRESNSTSVDDGCLSGSMLSITSFELLAYFVKLNPAPS